MTTDPRPHPDPLYRLLGPAGPELTCERCFDELDRYVEVELRRGGSAADQLVPGMRAHLDGCQACHEEHASLLALVEDHDRSTRRRR